MKIAMGADHAGFRLKQVLRDKLVAEGHQVVDLGTDSAESVDYPDFAAAVGSKVASAECDRGILVCSSGVGMSIAANKIPGIRAALGVSAEEVRLTRAHNDANVLAIGAIFTDEATARTLVDTFLDTGFDGGRHERRVRKIDELEKNHQK